MSGQGYNIFHGFDFGPSPPGFAPVQPYYSQIQGSYGWPAPTHTSFLMPCSAPIPAIPPQQPTMAHPSATPPLYDQSFPGVSLQNPNRGVGAPWGYNFLFPKENCPIHILKSPTKPWQTETVLQPWVARPFVKLLVPVSTTIKELMQNLGANNPDSRKNRLYEITEAGNGKWLKGMEIGGDDKDKCKRPIKDYGWDQTRTGKTGEKPLVWLYITKD